MTTHRILVELLVDDPMDWGREVMQARISRVLRDIPQKLGTWKFLEVEKEAAND